MTGRGRTIIQGGRAKAYRPLPAAARRRAIEDGLAAYERGDWFLAHELLEPAWMGTDDPVERDLHQGLIKLAAAYVHAVRGNAEGMIKNFRGSRDRLSAVAAQPRPAIVAERPGGIDVTGLVAAIDERLARVERERAVGPIDPPAIGAQN